MPKPKIRRPSAATIISVIALVFATCGLAVAATGGGGATIKACYQKKGGGLRIASRCSKRERLLSWNRQGPRGLQGMQGVPGQQGAKGDRGDACSSVDPACRGPQGNNGLQGPGAVKLLDTLVTADFLPNKLEGSVGPWGIYLGCSNGDSRVSIQGPGVAEGFGVQSLDDGPSSTFTFGSAIITSNPVEVVHTLDVTPGHYARTLVTAALRDSTHAAMVHLELIQTPGASQGTCVMSGAAIPTS